MGCDIHLHIEVKIQGEWRHWARTYPPRNYDMFALMAGVRNRGDITPLSEPRGLPDDITFLTRYEADYDGNDGHNHSWLNIDEIDKLRQSWSENCSENWDFEWKWVNTYLLGNGFRAVPNENIEDVRFVFWFDC